jgi:hypothetical protein
VCKAASTSHTPMGFHGLLQGELYLFFLTTVVQTGFGTHKIYYPMGAEVSLPEGKQLEHKPDHSTPSSAEVKNGGAILPFPHMATGETQNCYRS